MNIVKQKTKQMYSYKIELISDDVLRVGFNNLESACSAPGDRIVKDAAELLEIMISSGELSGGSLLKINGPQSVPVAYVLAHRLIHLFGAIAICDPKLNGYIVISSHGSEYKIGDVITA
jgi:CRISPR-associated protein Csx3